MSERPRVVLLAPPANSIQIRDLYCSVTSKANYYWAPIDLLVAGGVGRTERRPGPDVGVAVGAEPGEPHLDAAEPCVVDEVGHQRGVDAEVAPVGRVGRRRWSGAVRVRALSACPAVECLLLLVLVAGLLCRGSAARELRV